MIFINISLWFCLGVVLVQLQQLRSGFGVVGGLMHQCGVLLVVWRMPEAT